MWDTGAMYRAMGLLFLRKGIDSKDAAAIEAAAREADVTIGYENGEQQVYLNGGKRDGVSSHGGGRKTWLPPQVFIRECADS